MILFENKNLLEFYNNSKDVDWKKIIEKGVDLLVSEGKAKGELKNKIISATKKFGPYYILLPNVALLHAEAGPWCIEPAISLLLLDKPVSFGFDDQDKKDAKIVFTLSAPNNDSHMKLIKELATILQDEVLLKQMMISKNFEELQEVVKRMEKKWK